MGPKLTTGVFDRTANPHHGRCSDAGTGTGADRALAFFPSRILRSCHHPISRDFLLHSARRCCNLFDVYFVHYNQTEHTTTAAYNVTSMNGRDLASLCPSLNHQEIDHRNIARVLFLCSESGDQPVSPGRSCMYVCSNHSQHCMEVHLHC